MINEVNYVELGLSCANICEVLHRGTSGRRADQLSPSVLRAIEQLTVWVEATMPAQGDLLTKVSIPGL